MYAFQDEIGIAGIIALLYEMDDRRGKDGVFFGDVLYSAMPIVNGMGGLILGSGSRLEGKAHIKFLRFAYCPEKEIVDEKNYRRRFDIRMALANSAKVR